MKRIGAKLGQRPLAFSRTAGAYTKLQSGWKLEQLVLGSLAAYETGMNLQYSY